MFYRLFRTLARIALGLFFRKIEVEARENVPSAGPVLLVPNHTNALVDPLVVMIALDRALTVTAKNVLGKNPLLGWLMARTGVITFHRRQDVGKGADPRQNVRSLERCRAVLADGGALCIFPEGVSHSDPQLREFRLGPARIALDYLHKDGNPGGLRIIPVGLLYTAKDRFRSDVWLRFGPPIDVARWAAEHPESGAPELTHALAERVRALTLNFATRKESAILSWAAEIVAGGARNPPPLGTEAPAPGEWFRLLRRLQEGYQTLLRTDPELLRSLARRTRRYRARLKRTGIAPDEVYLPMHAGRAAFFVIRELELAVVGAPIGLFGAVNHCVPYWAVKTLARKLSTDKDHWASNVVYPGVVIFPLCYLLQLTAAWLLLPVFWAALYTVALPYSGYYAILLGDRLRQSRRRTVTFLRFLLHPGEQRALASEGSTINGQIRDLAARLQTAPQPPEIRTPDVTGVVRP
jgi:1-acyl-sn-glycerol-3-phosphate acyltransferase